MGRMVDKEEKRRFFVIFSIFFLEYFAIIKKPTIFDHDYCVLVSINARSFYILRLLRMKQFNDKAYISNNNNRQPKQ